MTKRTRPIFAGLVVMLIGGLALAFAPAALAEGDGAPDPRIDDGSMGSAEVSQPRLPVYQPPKVGKPARTIGGGSRGPGDGYPELYVLVPDHVGQTSATQPSLFWYVDEVPKTMVRVVFTLHDEDGLDPLVEAALAPIQRAGIHRIRLSDYEVKLEPGIEYEWSVTLVLDESARAKDVTASGWIDRVEASTTDRTVSSLASQGLWYDALGALDEQIEAKPDDKGLVEIRSALLRQVGLVDIADATDATM
jgi:hypothetical protein